MSDTTSAAPSDAVLQPDDSEFEQWYATMFKPAMERSPFDKYVARQAWYAAWNRRATGCGAREPMEADVAAGAQQRPLTASKEMAMTDHGGCCEECAARHRDAINKIAVRLMCENQSWSSVRAMDRAKIEYLKGRLE